MRTPDPTLLREVLATTSARRLATILWRKGDASDLTLYLLGMAPVAGMLLTIGAMK